MQQGAQTIVWKKKTWKLNFNQDQQMWHVYIEDSFHDTDWDSLSSNTKLVILLSIQCFIITIRGFIIFLFLPILKQVFF